MPMIPGPLAVATYATIKIAGYSGVAYALNRFLERQIHIWRFGMFKTGIGLAGGLIYFLALLVIAHGKSLSDAQVYAGALPFRSAAWALALALFYGFRTRTGTIIAALLVGVLWSYLLDRAMALLYHLPGMEMAFC